jgi:hypothetical protein
VLYTIARSIFNIAKLFWTLFFIVALSTYVGNILSMQEKDVIQGFSTSVIGSLLLGSHQRLAVIVLGPIVAITILAGSFTAIEEHHRGGKGLKKYLREVADNNHDLKPTGFAQQSALISVSIPLDDIFIRLNVISDRPRYDMPSVQINLLEELRKRSDLSPEDREEQIQALRVIWYSQLGQELEVRQTQNVTIEEVLQNCTAEQPGAIILGTPGSGKSTTMRWFAFHMAHAYYLPNYRHWFNAILRLFKRLTHISLSWGYHPPQGLLPYQIPIFLRITDYAKALNKSESQNLSFEKFFFENIKDQHPSLINLADKLLYAMQKGRCLLLLDGLDEVANDDLRRRVAENISFFIANNSPEKHRARRYNRFIITSRIVGYEAGIFANYAHYTLQDLRNEQIEQFLTNWCPAVERHQKTFAQGMRKLTSQQKTQANKVGLQQRDRLLEALRNSPGIERLAVNPLLLTILALVQRSGKTLPHRRINLYQVVTRTLLDNWNQETGRRVFSPDELPLLEYMLGCLAYQLHTSDLLLTETKVKEIVSQAMTDFYGQPTTNIAIMQFIQTIRSSSGLFVESGQGFFSFMHRTFQEYFVALHLLLSSSNELQEFVRQHCHTSIWHEPLLLLIAYKSTQSSHEEQRQASLLINIILESNDDFDVLLHRNLFFAASGLIDCSTWTINHSLQQGIANRLFDLYGDSLGAGRYVQIKKEIERIALLWLRGQPVEITDARPPLLDAWRKALCDHTNQIRQEGATHLIASLVQDLSNCPKLVLITMVPALLQLSGLVDISYPPEQIRLELPQPPTCPATQKVEEYAFIALRLLDNDGPAGWLRNEWLKRSQQQPELIKRLSQHSRELDYPIILSALPANHNSSTWKMQLQLSNEWQYSIQRNFSSQQTKLLEMGESVRFPYSYLIMQILHRELNSPRNEPWHTTWDRYLQEEMSYGHSATYLPCLYLRLLLKRGIEQEREQVANELIETFLSFDQRQIQVLFAITSLYLLNLQGLREALDMRDIPNLLDMRNLRNLKDIDDMQNMQYLRELKILQDILDILNTRYLLNLRDFLDSRDLLNLQKWLETQGLRGHLTRLRLEIELSLIKALRNELIIHSVASNVTEVVAGKLAANISSWLFQVVKNYQKDLQKAKNKQNLTSQEVITEPWDLLDLIDLRNIFDSNLLFYVLCDKLVDQKKNSLSILLALYSIISSAVAIPATIKQKVQESLQNFEQQAEQMQSLMIEHRLLISAIRRKIDKSTISQSTSSSTATHDAADEKAAKLNTLKHLPILSKEDVEGLLLACTDTRQLSQEKWKELTDLLRVYTTDSTVGQIAWQLLSQSYSFETDASAVVVLSLDDENPIVCTASALLLQNCKRIPNNQREEAIHKIARMLKDEKILYRSLDLPNYCVALMDDVMFDAVKALKE